MLRIPVPTPNTKQTVTLGGVTYDLKFAFNYFDNKWRISVYKGFDIVIINTKVTEPKSLIRVIATPIDFSHGDLQVHLRSNTKDPCGLSNFGIDKDYELFYFSNSELGL